jgi:hypothetical protein
MLSGYAFMSIPIAPFSFVIFISGYSSSIAK